MSDLEVFNTSSTDSQVYISDNQQFRGHNRYYIYIDDITVGWVIRYPKSWSAVLKENGLGLPLGHTKSRSQAIEIILERLNEMAHTDDDFGLMA